MSEIPYDPDFKHLNPPGWQRLPRATRDAIIRSPFLPIKIRIWTYCLQVWDERSEHGYAGANLPIRQKELVAQLGIIDGTVSAAVHQMKAEGWIDVRNGGRIYPVEQPVFKRAAAESKAARVKAFWQQHDPDAYQKYMKWEEEGKVQKKAFRRAENAMIEHAAKPGPKYGPSAGPTGNDVGPGENSVGPRAYPLVTEREERENIYPSSSSSVLTTIENALCAYGNADDDAAKNLLAKCRTAAPDVTAEEIAEAVHRKGTLSQKSNVKNPIGFLLKVVPTALPQILKKLRASAAPAAEEEQLTQEQESEMLVQFIGGNPNHPQCPEQVSRLLDLQIADPAMAKRIMQDYATAQPELAAIVLRLLDGARNNQTRGVGG